MNQEIIDMNNAIVKKLIYASYKDFRDYKKQERLSRLGSLKRCRKCHHVFEEDDMFLRRVGKVRIQRNFYCMDCAREIGFVGNV